MVKYLMCKPQELIVAGHIKQQILHQQQGILNLVILWAAVVVHLLVLIQQLQVATNLAQ